MRSINSKLFKFIVHLQQHVNKKLRINISKLFKFIVHIKTMYSYLGRKYFKTFQVYSSWKEILKSMLNQVKFQNFSSL